MEMKRRERSVTKPYEARWWAQRLITGYQRTLSPMLGQRCRYYPSCSRYAYDAIGRHGLIRGGWMAVCRLIRCHPFREGGYDPVPGLGGDEGIRGESR